MKPAELLPTWTNGRLGPAGIAKRLDQFLIEEELLLPSYNVQALVNLPFLSAHAPICLQIGDGRFGAGQLFKFNPQWMRDISFNSLVRLVWADTTLTVPGDTQGNLIRKLFRLKSLTIHWLKDKKETE